MTIWKQPHRWLACIALVLLHDSIPLVSAHRCELKIPSDVVQRPRQAIIAHRGASYNLPEHSLEAYRLAMEQGADYIEVDLVLTSDGKFVAMHSMDLNLTTNVHEKFPGRIGYSSNHQKKGYWVYNFTYSEIQQLKLNQRVPEARSQQYDGKFEIPRLEQILDLWQKWNNELKQKVSKENKRVGLYLEVKDPEVLSKAVTLSNGSTIAEELIHRLYFNADPVVSIEDPNCTSLNYGEYLVPNVVLENFSGKFMEEVAEKWISKFDIKFVPPPPMVLLVEEKHCLNEEYWFQIRKWSKFLKGIAPDKGCLLGSSWESFIEQAREHDLAVHPWTERPEFRYIDPPFTTMEEEMNHLVCIVGVDGMFVEDVTAARVFVERTCARHQESDSFTKEDTLLMGLAAGLMGIFVGSIMTFWISQSRMCRSRRYRNLQLRVPTHEDIEMM